MGPLTAYLFGLLTVIIIFVAWYFVSDLNSDIENTYNTVFCKN